MYQHWTDKQGDINSKLEGFIIKMLEMYSEKIVHQKTVQSKKKKIRENK